MPINVEIVSTPISVSIGGATASISVSAATVTPVQVGVGPTAVPEPHANTHGAGGFDQLFDQNLNTDSSVTFDSISLPNGTQIIVGSWDNGTSGAENGISLVCAVNYELNWQGGRLKSTLDSGETAETIYCDSPIEFEGESGSVVINSTGITFPDGSSQATAADATRLLLAFNGSFADSGPYNHTVTPYGDAEISTAQSKYGGASASFAGDGYLETDPSVFDFGDDDFTVECWVYRSVAGDHGICGSDTTGAAAFHVFTDGSVAISFATVAAALISPAAAVGVEDWAHVVWQRRNGTAQIFVDGVEVAFGSVGSFPTPANALIGNIGVNGFGQWYLDGFIDNLRITRKALYDADFTPGPFDIHDLSTVAVTGSYDDLADLPTLFDGSYDSLTDTPSLGTASASDTTDFAAASHSHVVTDITDFPTLGTASASDTTDFAAASHSHAWSDITSGVPSTFTPSSHTHGNLSNDGLVNGNTTSGQIVVTTTGGALTTASSISSSQVSGLGTLATQDGTFSGTSSGENTGDQTITLTGDVTGSGTGSFAATLANSGVTAGSYGSASSVATFTVDAKGRLTAAGSTAVAIAADAITSGTVAEGRLPNSVILHPFLLAGM